MTLTEDGKELAARAVTAHAEVTADAVNGIPEADQRRLADLLRELLVSMESATDQS